ncbi:MAG: hypothetical protein JWQ32_720, partial [Marmoricola sp.]|nr:hypothetical protein [Marmoricola sp.]
PTDGLVRANPPKPPVAPTPTPTPTPTPVPTPPPPPVDVAALFDKAYAGKTPAELAAAPLSALKGITPTKAAAIAQALGASTVAELATNPYVLAAQSVHAEAGGA